MVRIFVSYSRADRQFVDEFVPLLRKVYGNNSIWFDDDIPGGHDWWQLILSEISKCELFIYLLSNESQASPYCQAEFQEALRLKKDFLPVIVRPKTQVGADMPDDLKDILEKTQYVDLSRGFKDYQASAALYAAIIKLLEHPPTELATVPSLEPVPEPSVADRRLAKHSIASWAIIIVLGLIGVVVLVVVLNFGLLNTGNGLTISPASSMTQIATDAAAAQYSNTPQLTGTLALLGFPGNPVTNNTQWTPVTEIFNGVEMALAPAGCFTMGSESTARSNWGPATTICFDNPFWIDRFEVANDQFQRLAGVAALPPDWPRPNQPRTSVTWFEARDFCALRGAHLPTEAEWEYAVRGPDGLYFPWGNEGDANNTVAYINTNGDGPADVGSKPGGLSWVGIQDMSGNVREWVSSEWRLYPYDASDGRESLDANVNRGIRGGSFSDPTLVLQHANYRGYSSPDWKSNSLGFRCARAM